MHCHTCVASVQCPNIFKRVHGCLFFPFIGQKKYDPGNIYGHIIYGLFYITRGESEITQQGRRRNAAINGLGCEKLPTTAMLFLFYLVQANEKNTHVQPV